MSDFIIKADWKASDDSNSLYRETTADLRISVNGRTLTQNINGWTKEVQDSVLVSTYPLAGWFAYHWWRLENEFFLDSDLKPSTNWREAHELGAANHGYVWPKILFVSDGRYINIWSDLVPTPLQSVNYTGKLDSVQSIPIANFQQEVISLIESTIQRISGNKSDLENIWNLVREDMLDPKGRNDRTLEAILGFDPEECPEKVLKQAKLLQKRAGLSSVKEIAPFLLKNTDLQDILQNAKGFKVSCPQIKINETCNVLSTGDFPWQQGVNTARQLREQCDFGTKPVSDKQLLDLLAIPADGIRKYNSYSADIPVSVGKSERPDKWQFIPRKKNTKDGKRFELARLLGDSLIHCNAENEWLVTSDSKSFRQKFQRAFAAEFLCPIHALDEYLNDDFSENKREQAAGYFQVSSKAIDTLLWNNGKIQRGINAFPYSV